MPFTRRHFLKGFGAALTVNVFVPSLGAGEAAALGLSFDRVIDDALRENRIVGAVVLASHNGTPIYSRAAGMADRENGKPMAMNSIFRLASVSKAYVSVAAMTLVERGVISLEDPVTRFLPAFTPRMKDGSTPRITVRHLLTHTAGLRYGFGEGSGGPYRKARVSTGLDQPGLSMEENLRRIASVPLTSLPGTRFAYSIATDVLGALLAAAMNTSLNEVVREAVTKPLGIKDTGFTVSDASRLTTPYADAKPKPAPMRGEVRLPLGSATGILFAPDRILNTASYPSGGAGMAGTAPDMLRFVDALCLGGAPLLKDATLRGMCANQIGQERVEPGWGFGLGWSVLLDPQTSHTPQSAGTAAWGGVYGHSWFFDPVRRLSVVAFTNTAFAGMTGPFPSGIREAAYANIM